jgi:hypothetical protein
MMIANNTAPDLTPEPTVAPAPEPIVEQVITKKKRRAPLSAKRAAMCSRCHVRKPLKGRRRCEECREYGRGAARIQREKRVLNGQCIACGSKEPRPSDGKIKYCDKCSKARADRAKAARRQKNGHDTDTQQD